MELRPGYKKTDIGMIPEDWDENSIGQISLILGRIGFRGYAKKDIVPEGNGAISLSPSNIIDGRLSLEGSTYISWEKWEESPEIKIYEGDTVIVKTGSTVGKVAYVDKLRFPATLNPQMVVLKKRKIDDLFLGYAVSFETFKKQLESAVVGGALPTLSQKQIAGFKIAVPRMVQEQQAIAGAISDADAAIRWLSRLIAKKRDLRQGAMQRLLTGQTRLKGFSAPWQKKRLDEIGEVSSAGVDKKSHSDEIPVRLLNYMDVYRSNIIVSSMLSQQVTAKEEQAHRCAVARGDVFFTPTSETSDDIGHSAVAMEDIPDAVYSYHLVRLRLRELWDIRFRAYAFKTKDFMDQASVASEGSGTRYVITLPKFRALTVWYPADPSEQAAISGVLSDMDAEIAALIARLAKTRALKQAMMQALLTGRVRLPFPREQASTPNEAAYA